MKKKTNEDKSKISIRDEIKKEHKLRSKVTNSLAVNRLFREMSQQELADILGTKKSTISRIEAGEQNITLDYVDAIAKALNKDVSFVMEDHKIEYGDKSEYSLKLYDDILIEFSLGRGDMAANIQYVNEDLKHLFPLDLELTSEGIYRWLSKRTIPKNRELVGHILSALNLEMSNVKGIIDVCMGLSLNDSYWVVQKGFSGTFDKYNLYHNRFNEALSVIAYVGHGNSINDIGTTPELTTGGMLRKSWHFSSSNGIHLYKAGTSGFANAGNEPYSEFYASQIAERMGLNAVHYDLARWHGILASKCKLFTDIDTSYIPIGRIVRTDGIDACLDYYKTLGDNFYQELASMLVFDAVILNEDRHFGNFGVLRNNHTGEIIAPAPIFDNGISLLCYGMKNDLTESLDEYVASRTTPYGSENGFIPLAKRVMGPKQKEELRRLINFHFEDSDVSDLPAWRLRILEYLIQKRVKLLLEA